MWRDIRLMGLRPIFQACKISPTPHPQTKNLRQHNISQMLQKCHVVANLAVNRRKMMKVTYCPSPEYLLWYSSHFCLYCTSNQPKTGISIRRNNKNGENASSLTVYSPPKMKSSHYTYFIYTDFLLCWTVFRILHFLVSTHLRSRR